MADRGVPSKTHIVADVTIRPARRRDLAVLRHSGASVDGVLAPALRRQEAGAALLLFALVEPWPLAHLLIDFPAMAADACGRLGHLWMHDAATGGAIGSELLATAERAVSAKGLRATVAEVDTRDADAMRFYQAHGYALVGETSSAADRDGERREVARPCWVLRKELCATASRTPQRAPSPGGTRRPGLHAAAARSLVATDAVSRLVADAYGIVPDGCALLRSLNNDVYRLQRDRRSWILKVYGHAWVKQAELEWELDLLSHLRSAGVRCPATVATVDGSRWLRLAAAEGERLVVLFEALPGSKPTWPPAASVGRAYGRAFAELYEVADSFSKPHPTRTMRVEELVHSGRCLAERFLVGRPRDKEFVLDLLQQADERLNRLVARGLDWGALHGDVSLDNVHVLDGETLAVFDLENCSMGWRAADICAARQGIAWPDFLEGYRERRPLSGDDLAAVDWFVVPMALDNLRWHLEVKGSYRGAELVSGEIDPTIQHLKEWSSSVLAKDTQTPDGRP